VQLMTNQEEGAYHRLLRFQWRNGYIPGDVKGLARIVRETPRTTQKLWATLTTCFPDGKNPRLEDERQKAEDISAKRSVAGSKRPTKNNQLHEQLNEVCSPPCDIHKSHVTITGHNSQPTKDKTQNTSMVFVGDRKAIPENQLSAAVTEWVGTSFAWETEVEVAMKVVFSYWVARTDRNGARTLLTSERKSHLRARLREAPKGDIATAISPLLWAVDGVMSSEFHVVNGHTKLDQIFRNRSRLEGFAGGISASGRLQRKGRTSPIGTRGTAVRFAARARSQRVERTTSPCLRG
jgi:uncharacterized protein YdaU (DUF1376 family)